MKKEPIKQHPIQLVELYPGKLFIEAIDLKDKNIGILGMECWMDEWIVGRLDLMYWNF